MQPYIIHQTLDNIKIYIVYNIYYIIKTCTVKPHIIRFYHIQCKKQGLSYIQLSSLWRVWDVKVLLVDGHMLNLVLFF